ncbi:MAG: MarR family transcriptional regulator [Deltaproteobacteria bacterium]|nr:MarR family transcriptional regulator [Deltaproteobacteria bacterium]
MENLMITGTADSRPISAATHADVPLFDLPRDQYEYRILRSLRQIIRAVEVHSRKLDHDFQITGPQLSCLMVIREHGPIAVTRLAEKAFLSPGTVVGITDRLEEKDLVRRVRSKKDRRLVEIGITEAGEKLIGRTPPPLQGTLTRALKEMPDRERIDIAMALERVVTLMGAENLTAAPILAISPPGDTSLG